MKKIKRTLLAVSCLAATTFGIAVIANVNTNIKPAHAVTEGHSVSTLSELKNIFATESYTSMYIGASLTCDIVTDETLYVGPNSKIALDLNGHVLAADHSKNEKFSVIEVVGSLHIERTSEISWTRPHEGKYADLPTGGVITGGKAEKGGGIYIHEGATVNIDGASIYGNSADIGGGVYSEVDITIGNSAKIFGNTTLNGEKKSNLYLKNDKRLLLNHGFAWEPLKNNIGISMEGPGTFLDDERVTTQYRKYFFSDSENHKVAITPNNVLKIQAVETINISVEHGKVISDPEYFVEGDTVTLKTIPDDGYVIDKIKVNNGDTTLNKQNLNTYTFLATDSTTLTAKFVEDYATKISMKKRPTKLEYYVGEDLDLKGAKINVYMASEITLVIDVTDDMVSGFNSNEAGTFKIIVTYQGKTTSFLVTVLAKPHKVNVGLIIAISAISLCAVATIIIVIAKKKKKKSK